MSLVFLLEVNTHIIIYIYIYIFHRYVIHGIGKNWSFFSQKLVMQCNTYSVDWISIIQKKYIILYQSILFCEIAHGSLESALQSYFDSL